MKLVIFGIMFFGLSQIAAAEDMVDCRTFTVAVTNALTVKVSGLEENEKVDQLEINYPDEEMWHAIENDKTFLRHAGLNGISVTIDDGSQTKRIVILNWFEFKDGARVPAAALVKYPNGDTELRAHTFCSASRI
ncbi:MAG: hypothetical protein AB7H97_20040 [Pseudobdellovibrionaceae bacterium]